MPLPAVYVLVTVANTVVTVTVLVNLSRCSTFRVIIEKTYNRSDPESENVETSVVTSVTEVISGSVVDVVGGEAFGRIGFVGVLGDSVVSEAFVESASGFEVDAGSAGATEEPGAVEAVLGGG